MFSCMLLKSVPKVFAITYLKRNSNDKYMNIVYSLMCWDNYAGIRGTQKESILDLFSSVSDILHNNQDINITTAKITMRSAQGSLCQPFTPACRCVFPFMPGPHFEKSDSSLDVSVYWFLCSLLSNHPSYLINFSA